MLRIQAQCDHCGKVMNLEPEGVPQSLTEMVEASRMKPPMGSMFEIRIMALYVADPIHPQLQPLGSEYGAACSEECAAFIAKKKTEILGERLKEQLVALRRDPKTT